MKQNYTIEDIENYLSHKLSPSETTAFEAHLESDADFATEVQLHKDILLGIDLSNEKALAAVFDEVAADLETDLFFSKASSTGKPKKEASIRRFNFRNTLAIAASIALLITAGWWMMSRTALPQDLYASHFSTHKDILSSLVEDRLAETGFGVDKERLALLQQGMKAYQNKDYAQSISVLLAYDTAGAREAFSNTADFYLAMSYMATGRIDEAQSLLLPLSKQNDFDMSVDAQWYLALSYLQQDQPAKAKPLLEALQDHSTYSSVTRKILKNL